MSLSWTVLRTATIGSSNRTGRMHPFVRSGSYQSRAFHDQGKMQSELGKAIYLEQLIDTVISNQVTTGTFRVPVFFSQVGFSTSHQDMAASE